MQRSGRSIIACPTAWHVEPGSIVVAPLGPRQLLGVAWEAERLPTNEVPDSRLRPLARALDVPPIAAPLRRLCEWTADYYLAPLASVLRMVLPSSAALEGSRQLIEYRPTGVVPERLTPQREKALAAHRRPARHRPRACRSCRRQRCGAARASSTPARSKRSRSMPTVRSPCPDPEYAPPRAERRPARGCGKPCFGNRQGLRSGAARRRHRLGQDRSLFRSDRRVPPAGQAGARPPARDRADRAVPQALRGAVRLRSGRLAFGPALVAAAPRTGAASPAAKLQVTVGARSALFLPYPNLGLIVVDEAHEPSFKQEDGVQYHARDTAVMRAKFEDIPVILSSATPAIESRHMVEIGRYREVSLPERFAGASPARDPRDRPDAGSAATRPLACAHARR